ncbi:hypothetical protein AB0O86_37435, partial [Streptomyces hirsutus]
STAASPASMSLITSVINCRFQLGSYTIDRTDPVFRCKPSSGTERTSDESTAVSWLTPDEVSERMAEVYAIRLLDALDGNGPHVRSHDGKQLIPAG